MPSLLLRLAVLFALLAACDWLAFPCPDSREAAACCRLPMPRGTRPEPFEKNMKKNRARRG